MTAHTNRHARGVVAALPWWVLAGPTVHAQPPSGTTTSEAPLEVSTLIAFVEPLPSEALVCRPPTVRARRLVRTYFESLLDWDAILLDRIRPVQDKPGCAYYGRGGHTENDVRLIAYAALVNAFLAEALPPAGVECSAERRARMQKDAVAVLRYLVQGHVTGTGACVNGSQICSRCWASRSGPASSRS